MKLRVRRWSTSTIFLAGCLFPKSRANDQHAQSNDKRYDAYRRQHPSLSADRLLSEAESMSDSSYPFSSAGVPPAQLASHGMAVNDDTGERYSFSPASNESSGPYLPRKDRFVDSTRDSNDHPDSANTVKNPMAALPPLRTPVVYRYYGRQKTRHASSGGSSLCFLLIGPNVDHWKVTGQQLAARGFNVIAVGPSPAASSSSSATTFDHRTREGPGLVMQLMDALRWSSVVLVGCDSEESSLAVQAALRLSPERVAGLILCGNLKDVSLQDLIATATPTTDTVERPKKLPNGPFALDQFLTDRLQCPFTIVWDGDTSKVSSLTTPQDDGEANSPPSYERQRSVIIGGGTAPHRRRPEIFAWILTRFVEQKVAPSVLRASKDNENGSTGAIGSQLREPSSHSQRHDTYQHRLPSAARRDDVNNRSWSHIEFPWRVDEMFNEESMVVFGRVAATALFYAMALKTVIYQYDNIRGGVDVLASAKRNTVGAIKNGAVRLVSLLFFFRRRRPAMDQEDTKSLDRAESSFDLKSSPSLNANDKSDPEDPPSEDPKVDKEAKEPKQQQRDLDYGPMFFLDHVVA